MRDEMDGDFYPADEEAVEAEFMDDAPGLPALARSGEVQPFQASQYGELIRLAKQFPRRYMEARAKALKQAEILGAKPAGQDENGSMAYYSYKIGGKRIEGVSIWMAQAVRKAWGNCVSQASPGEIQGSPMAGGACHVQCHFMDLESIDLESIGFVFQIPAAPKKFAKNADEAGRWQSIAVRKATSIARRNMIERNVPRQIIDDCLERAKLAHQGRLLGDTPLDKAASMVMAALAKLGVTQKEAERYVDEAYKNWTAVDIRELSDAVHAIRGGDDGATVEKLFRQPFESPTKITPEDLAGAGAKNAGNGKAAQQQAPEPAGPPEPEATQQPEADKKRGRPRGSKNKPKDEPPEPEASSAGAAAAPSEDARTDAGNPSEQAEDSNTQGAVDLTPEDADDWGSFDFSEAPV